MAKKLMSLRMVPDDELLEIIAILAENNIECYQTTAGSFGISLPALWIRDNSEFAMAKDLSNAYQNQRQADVKQLYREQKSKGKLETVVGKFLTEPLRFIFYFLAMIFIAYISLIPFVKPF